MKWCLGNPQDQQFPQTTEAVAPVEEDDISCDVAVTDEQVEEECVYIEGRWTKSAFDDTDGLLVEERLESENSVDVLSSSESDVDVSPRESSSETVVDDNEGTGTECHAAVLSTTDKSFRPQSLADSEQRVSGRRHEKVRRRTDVRYRANAVKMASKFARRKNVCSKPYAVGDLVSVKIPKQERHGTDLPRLPCIVVQVLGKTQVKYRLRCQNGVIDSTFRGGDLEQYNGTFTEDLSVTGWESVKRISLRSTSHMIWNETGTTRCICKSGCTTERCRCRKAQRLCSSRCHAGKSCKNGSTDGKESKRTIAKSKTADNQGQPQKETCYERKQEVNLSEEATLSKKPGNSVSPDPRQGTTTASSIATRTSIGIGKRDIKILESSTAWLNDLIIKS